MRGLRDCRAFHWGMRSWRELSLVRLWGASLGLLFLPRFLRRRCAPKTRPSTTSRARFSTAKMAQQSFARGLLHCSELNGTNFYFQPRDRVLNLEDYHRSLESLALQGGFNPETKRPWNKQDADARWAQVQQQAMKDKANCALVASLPDLQKKLQALQQQAAASQSDPSATKSSARAAQPGRRGASDSQCRARSGGAVQVTRCKSHAEASVRMLEIAPYHQRQKSGATAWTGLTDASGCAPSSRDRVASIRHRSSTRSRRALPKISVSKPGCSPARSPRSRCSARPTSSCSR